VSFLSFFLSFIIENWLVGEQSVLEEEQAEFEAAKIVCISPTIISSSNSAL